VLKDTAVALLGKMTAADQRPALSADELALLLDAVGVTDATVDPAVWTGSLDAAAAEGWAWKAGKVAGDFNFSADDASYSKADVLKHCVDMRSEYLAKCGGSTGHPFLWDDVALVVNG
jgi:hypothetical protein